MKKQIVSILAVVMALVMVFTTVAFAQESNPNADPEKMAESVHAFDAAHPEYKDAWYEIMQAFDDVLTKEFSEAFENIQEMAGELVETKRAEHDVKAEDGAALDELLQNMSELINASLIQSIADSFATIDRLAEDGEVSFDDAEETEKEAEEVTKADLEEALEAYNKYKETHTGFAQNGEPRLFGNLNREILNEFSAAFADAREELEAEFKAIFEKYEIAEEDQDTIVDMLDMMVQQINDNFLETMKENTAAGPIDFGPRNVFVSSNGVMSINRPGDDDKWVIRRDDEKRFVLSDGIDTIIIRHFANGEDTGPIHAVEEDTEGFVEYTELILSNADEIFYVTGVARNPEEADYVREAVKSFQVLKYGTEKEAAGAEPEYTIEEMDEIRYCVEKDGANVREIYMARGDVLGVIEMGAEAHITGRVMCNGEGTDWLRVDYEGQDGYVWSSHFAAFEP